MVKKVNMASFRGLPHITCSIGGADSPWNILIPSNNLLKTTKLLKFFQKMVDVGRKGQQGVELHQQSQMLSVMDIAGICGVARSTVSYWIAEKSLPAGRSGKRHMVSIKDLVPFLETEGHPVPKALLETLDGIYPGTFRPFKTCWEYWEKDPSGKDCEGCPVFMHHLTACFTARQLPGQRRRTDCSRCRYFYEYYFPTMSFIHQIRNPAAIYKDLYIWSGNKAWADLCGIKTEDLIGAGAEEFIHPASLKNIINYDKKIRLGETSEVFRFNLFFTSKNSKKIKADLSISPLKNPDGTWLAVVERQYQS